MDLFPQEHAQVEPARYTLLHTSSHIPNQPSLLVWVPNQPLASFLKSFPNSIPNTPIFFSGLSPQPPSCLLFPSECPLLGPRSRTSLSEIYHTKNMSIILALLDWADSQQAISERWEFLE